MDINRSQEVIVIIMRTLKMKSLILSCLMLLTGSAWAEWQLVATVTEDGDRYYSDPQSVRINGNKRLMWEIEDLKVRDKSGELSRRSRIEYDCSLERYRRLSFSTHSGAMASGTVLLVRPINELAPWLDIPPGTAVDLRFKYACAL